MTETDIVMEGFVKVTQAEVLAETGGFSEMWGQLVKVESASQYKKDQVLYVFTKPHSIVATIST